MEPLPAAYGLCRIVGPPHATASDLCLHSFPTGRGGPTRRWRNDIFFDLVAAASLTTNAKN
jgi:hypothetical protein